MPRVVAKKAAPGKIAAAKKPSKKAAAAALPTSFFVPDFDLVEIVMGASGNRSKGKSPNSVGGKKKLTDVELINSSDTETSEKNGALDVRKKGSSKKDRDAYSIPLNELTHDKSRKKIFYLDAQKRKCRAWVNFRDYLANGPLPLSTNKPCWYCRHSFSGMPLGCPLVYHHHKTSGLEKERIESKLQEANFNTDTNDFFEVEGVFCSLNCVKTYAIEHCASPKYKNTLALISLLAQIIFEYTEEIIPSPSWKMLIAFGGPLKIEEYRSSFGILEYRETINMQRPYLFASSALLSEHKVTLFRGVESS